MSSSSTNDVQLGQENVQDRRKLQAANSEAFLQPQPRSTLKDIGNELGKLKDVSNKKKEVQPFVPVPPSVFVSPYKAPENLRVNNPDAAASTSKAPEPVPEEESSLVTPIPDFDVKDSGNSLLMPNYVGAIYKYLRELETKYPINADFMSDMTIIPAMRAVVVDWLVHVSIQFKLLPETLYISIALLDRFLQIEKTITRNNLQLVGLGALFIACKYEEIYAPSIEDLHYVSDKAYSIRDILKMELRILKTLDFALGRPIPLQFLRRYTKVASVINDEFDVLHHTLAKYLMELTLLEYSCCHYLPSALAAAALCLSLIVFDRHNTPVELLWNKVMVHYSGYKVEDLQSIVEHLASLVLKAETSKLQSIFKKYTSSKFYSISTLGQLKSTRIQSLATKRLMNN